MRLSGKEIILNVLTVPQLPDRPIRVRGGGLTINMTTTEAIDLANQLADAVEHYDNERTTP